MPTGCYWTSLDASGPNYGHAYLDVRGVRGPVYAIARQRPTHKDGRSVGLEGLPAGTQNHPLTIRNRSFMTSNR